MLGSRKVTVLGGDKFRDEYSLAFDGTDDELDCGDISVFDGLSDFSISTWIKVDASATGTNPILSKGSYNADGAAFHLKYNPDSSSGRVSFSVEKNSDESDGEGIYGYKNSLGTYLDGKWAHFTVSYSNTNNSLIFYINGVEIANYTEGSTDTMSSASGTFIDIPTQSSRVQIASGFNGNISEMATYNIALTQAQVKDIYNGQEPYNHKEGIASGNLLTWWRMGDGLLDAKNSSDFDAGIINNEVTVSLGSDLFGGKGDMSDASYWTEVGATDKIVFADGVCKFLASDNGTDNMSLKKNGIMTVDKVYRLDITITANEHVNNILLINFSDPYINITNTGAANPGDYTIYFRAESANFELYRWYSDSSQDTSKYIYFDNALLREVTGNAHCIMKNMSEGDFEGDTP